jgi:hypothetical protein
MQVSDARAVMVSSEKPLPDSIKPSPALAEVIRLSEAGLDESVVLAYITNNPSAFGLGSEEIIFLTDIGVPGPVIAAMIQKDHLLGQSSPMAVPNLTPPAATPAAPSALAAGVPPPGYVPPGYAAPMQMEQAPPNAEPPPAPDDSYAGFYDTLAPYGNWVNVDGYGVCWQPAVAVVNPGWRPYCDRGHWVYTDCGWYWYSDYSWGWAAFHHGRWFPHNQLGWCWLPDKAWAPAWVAWRYSNSYCGWAPLPPAPRAAPLAPRAQLAPLAPLAQPASLALTSASFNVVPLAALQDHHVSRYALPRDQANKVLSAPMTATTVVTRDNQVFNPGVPAQQVAVLTHTQVHPVPVRSVVGASLNTARVEHLTPGPRTPAAGQAAPAMLAASAEPAIPFNGAASAQVVRQATIKPESALSGAGQIDQQAASHPQQAIASKPQQTLPWQPASQVARRSQPSAPGAINPQNQRPAEIGRVNTQPNYQRPASSGRPTRPEDDMQAAAGQIQAASANHPPAAPPPVEVPRYAPAAQQAPAASQFSRQVPAIEPRAAYVPPAQPAAPAPAQTHTAPSAPASSPARSTDARTGR